MDIVETTGTTQEKLDKYLGRKYKGKKVRRLTAEEIEALKEVMAEEKEEELKALEEARIAEEKAPPKEPEEWADNEVKPDEHFDASEEAGGLAFSDMMKMGDAAVEKFFKELDDKIAKERARLYKNVRSPPRSDKYIEFFKKKHPDRTEEEIRAGLVLKKDGVDKGWAKAVQDIADKHTEAQLSTSGGTMSVPGELSPHMWAENEVKPEEPYEEESFAWEANRRDREIIDKLIAEQVFKIKKTELERGLPPKAQGQKDETG